MEREEALGILNLDENFTVAEAKRSYRNLAPTCHPDLNPDNPSAREKFEELAVAYQLLTDNQNGDGELPDLADLKSSAAVTSRFKARAAKMAEERTEREKKDAEERISKGT